jgi:peroxiredoxin
MSEFEDFETTNSGRSMYVKYVLIVAGIYNLVFGAAVILFPSFAFNMAGMELPRYPQIWQCVGMVVGVYGIGYLIAARDPCRHWPIVLVGLAGKLLGPIGLVFAAAQGEFPQFWGTIILFNDLIWWFPFGAILFEAFKFNSNTSIGNPHDLDDTTVIFPSSRGRTLAEISRDGPLMIVFLRHLGCTFCKEALQDLAKTQKQIEQLGVSIALVHMSHPKQVSTTVKRYGLEEVDQFCDGTCEIYRAFGVERGSFLQLFGPKVIWRGIAATLKGNILGALDGDGFRMPSIFFMHEGQIQGSFRHQSAADRPNYVDLARQFRGSLKSDGDQLSA